MTASFSEKQLRAMTWWMPKSRDHGFDALVCDGAVRSGKTLAMGLGFFLWAMSCALREGGSRCAARPEAASGETSCRSFCRGCGGWG